MSLITDSSPGRKRAAGRCGSAFEALYAADRKPTPGTGLSSLVLVATPAVLEPLPQQLGHDSPAEPERGHHGTHVPEISWESVCDICKLSDENQSAIGKNAKQHQGSDRQCSKR